MTIKQLRLSLVKYGVLEYVRGMEWKISDTPVSYPDALDFMNARVDGIYAGTAEECIWLLEHPPLYTAGTSAKAQDLLERRFPVYDAGRGGEYTYHGPGQRVAYVMLDLRKRQSKPDVKRYVWSLEEWIIRSLGEFDIKGERRCGRVGIWVDEGDLKHGHTRGTSQSDEVAGHGQTKESKIAAIGVRIRRWVTMHGIAINVDPDLSHFGGIVPCGIAEHGVTSMTALGSHAGFADLDSALRRHLDVFDLA